MSEPTPYRCTLEVLAGGKGVPYGAGPRQDGDYNHGFRSLKGRTSEVAEIPEAVADPALAALLTAVNARRTAFFTVGCLSHPWAESGQHRRIGYVEFAFNDRGRVVDAFPYFEVFWAFTQMLKKENFSEPVAMSWQLLGASFLEAECEGMTCVVNVDTGWCATAEEAGRGWEKALHALAAVLTLPIAAAPDRIY